MFDEFKGPWQYNPAGTVGVGNSAEEVCRVEPGPYQEARGRLIAAAPEMLGALLAAKRLFDQALPRFNWGASALDANAIGLLNSVPRIVQGTIEIATCGRVKS